MLCKLLVPGLALMLVSLFGGCHQQDEPLAAAQIERQIVLGNMDSPVEVYVFTDWKCPACQALEPALEEMIPKILQKAQLIFVDVPIHQNSKSYTAINLSFLIHNKSEYVVLRHDLMGLAKKPEEPTAKAFELLAKSHDVQLLPLDKIDAYAGTVYFRQLILHFGIDRTPTIVVANKLNKQSKKFVGINEMDPNNILKAIDSLFKIDPR